MGFEFTRKDITKLNGVHPDLRRVLERARKLTDKRFTVLEGLRSLERQKALLEAGSSWTLNSRHLTGHAVDIAPINEATGKVSWDWVLYYPLAKVMKEAARLENVPIEWGGDWRKPKQDGPHWQLPWKQYPTKNEGPGERAKGERVQQISRSGTVQTGVGTVALGGVVIEQALTASKEVQGQLDTNTIFGLIIALLIVGFASYTIYRKWKDAGSPKLSEWF
jgi:peptidoglycan L-alanyl-D-glutamate endopeptidase CwlK